MQNYCFSFKDERETTKRFQSRTQMKPSGTQIPRRKTCGNPALRKQMLQKLLGKTPLRLTPSVTSTVSKTKKDPHSSVLDDRSTPPPPSCSLSTICSSLTDDHTEGTFIFDDYVSSSAAGKMILIQSYVSCIC